MHWAANETLAIVPPPQHTNAHRGTDALMYAKILKNPPSLMYVRYTMHHSHTEMHEGGKTKIV